jgi:hypothetical protein
LGFQLNDDEIILLLSDNSFFNFPILFFGRMYGPISQ